MTRMTATWRPTAETLSWATTEPAKHNVILDVDFELDFFRDYYVSKGVSLQDWDAAFRNWVRRSIRDASPKRNDPTKVKEAQRYARIERAGATGSGGQTVSGMRPAALPKENVLALRQGTRKS